MPSLPSLQLSPEVIQQSTALHRIHLLENVVAVPRVTWLTHEFFIKSGHLHNPLNPPLNASPSPMRTLSLYHEAAIHRAYDCYNFFQGPATSHLQSIGILLRICHDHHSFSQSIKAATI
eukprot:Gb_29348 [translate_table: standard]